jgi:superfamily II DNA or RNA helicase/HKD family nuclease
MSLQEGLYDTVVTAGLTADLSRLAASYQHRVDRLSPEESAERLIEALSKQLGRALDDVEGSELPRRQLELINSLLSHVRERLEGSAEKFESIADPPSILRAIYRTANQPDSPETGLAVPWLFSASKASPSLLAELRREIACCDHVDILVSFITVSGVRKLLDILKSATALDGSGNPRTRLRVLTTTYIGATEISALDDLASLPGCNVKISLDGRRTRLHAKAWIFRRSTGFGSVYVGSANLSGAALLGGLEWTVKFTEQRDSALFERAKAHFETLWNDAEFQHYDPTNEEHRSGLAFALRRESGRDGRTSITDSLPANTTFFEITPKDYQKEILDQLANEREHGRARNLVVAATGTGKTVIAAFDYRANCSGSSRPRLLFVAHREEILKQALRTYREVLRDHSFGQLLIGGASLTNHDHLFATIQSVGSRDILARCGADYWHTVVIDECHRIAAESFDSFATAIRPQILLGLTATPERADGKPIFPYFDNRADGSPAAELRLWRALDLQLLSPFEYYGCDDLTDFSDVPWDKPLQADAAIDKLVTGNTARARMVIDEWRRLSGNPRECRALAFCVSVEHAEFTANFFNEAGLPASCIVGSTDLDVRRKAPQRLASGELCVLVTCDLYNEGVDLPSVDTLLLLRPTQSPVLFQQQIGRGLRLSEGKDSCLVLDFVGRHRAEFRFDRLLSSITGLSRNELIHAVEDGFSSLPPGCHIQLEKFTRDQVLRSLRVATQQTWSRLKMELQAYTALRGRSNLKLSEFLREQAIEMDEVYRGTGRSGWTLLRRDAGVLTDQAGKEDEYFGKRFAALLHTDDPLLINLLMRVADPKTRISEFSPAELMRLQMVAYQIDGQHHQVGSPESFLERLSASSAIREEIGQLADVLQTRSMLRSRDIPGLEEVPLTLHASYGVREILTAAGKLTAEKRIPFQAGVLALEAQKIELLFVTLDKSEGFHDRTAYHDYAISTDRFHWQTQNSAGPDTKAGKRYLESASNGWTFQLFVRERKETPYRACGPVQLVNAEGDRPMSIIWKLCVPLPVRLFQEFSVLRGQ